MKVLSSLLSGMAGAALLTVLHESFRRNIKEAPRLDKLGMEGITKILEYADVDVPGRGKLHNLTLAADIVANTMYYSLVGLAPKNPMRMGAALGIAAGVGALTLPGPFGLTEKYSNGTSKTKTMTLFLYLTGGLMAGLTYKLINHKPAKRVRQSALDFALSRELID